MSGDLEDFLRRAAQRRQAKAAQQQQAAPPQPRPKPQYSDRRAERMIRPEPEEILTAEIVEEDTDSIASRMRRVEEAKQNAAKAKAKLEKARRRTQSGESNVPQPTVTSTGNAAADLIASLRRPGGIQQAILLREILERPEHRW